MTIPAAQATRVRYIILALTVVVAVLLYLDRYCLGYVTPYVKEDLRLTPGETGFMLSAFFLTYAFGQLPGGWLADRFGTRWMLSIYLAIWSVLTGLTGFASTFSVLLLLRFGCGLFEAGAYPACAGLIRRWFPYQQRGLASGIVSLGGRIGGAITPTVTGFFIILFMPVEKPSSIVNPERDLLDPIGLARNVVRRHPIGSLKNLQLERDRLIVRLILIKTLTEENQKLFEDLADLPDDANPTEEQIGQLVKIVGEWINNRSLFAGVDLSGLQPKLTDQASRFLDILNDPDGRQLDSNEICRLNRSILEVAFPGKIRQVLGDGWPPVLMIYGVIGVFVAVVFFSFHRDTPRQHFLANEAEAQLAEAHEMTKDSGDAPLPARKLWGSILADRGLWASSIVQFGTNFGWIILGNQLALYLFEVHQVPEGAERSFMASLPFFVALPTLILGGWWTDWMTKKYGPYVGRCFPIAATRFATAAAFILCWFLEGAWPVVIALSIMSIVHDLGLPAIWGYNLDVGKRNVGVVLGWGNMWGNLGAFVSPIVLLPLTNMFATKKAGYDALFLVCAAVFLVIGFLSLFIDASKPIGGVVAVATPEPSTGIRAGDPPIRPSDG